MLVLSGFYCSFAIYICHLPLILIEVVKKDEIHGLSLLKKHVIEHAFVILLILLYRI